MPEENKVETRSTEMTGATRSPETARALIRKTKRATRRRFPSEEKIRIVMEGVRGEVSVAELCRREGIERLKQLVADLSVANRLLKKKPELGLLERRRYGRVSAEKKREMIELVRRAPQPKRRTIAEWGLSRATFYRWQRR